MVFIKKLVLLGNFHFFLLLSLCNHLKVEILLLELLHLALLFALQFKLVIAQRVDLVLQGEILYLKGSLQIQVVHWNALLVLLLRGRRRHFLLRLFLRHICLILTLLILHWYIPWPHLLA